MQIVLIRKDGTVRYKIATIASLPQGFKLEDGETLSWEHQFMDKIKCPIEHEILSFGRSKIIKNAYSSTIVIRVESSGAAEFVKAIEWAINHVGGQETKVIKLPPSPDQSFVGGVKNDLIRLWNRLRSLFQGLEIDPTM